ncbi:MAG: metallophosphoesterase [Rhodospirillales bacterium]|jgi:Icc-related predicted phosphoesterase|nr:metallophosphoesterase [Rhodospirillales bacterium]
MKILAIADIDDFHWNHGSGQADVLLSCGDVSDQVVLEAAEAYHCQAVFAIKGNHDMPDPFPKTIVDLHLQHKEFEGIRFGGLNGSWKYKPHGHFLYEQEEVAERLSTFPSVDVFLSHNSPRGIHDRDDGIHVGFEGLNAYLSRARPRLLIHGHQHIERETIVAGTCVLGVYGWKLIEV